MKTSLREIHEQLGITAHHLESNKLEPHQQPPLDQLKVVEIDFEGKPFILRYDAGDAWLTMKNEAAKAKVNLQPFSGFRSYAHQKRLIENHLKNGRSLETILTHVAIPGFSEHHTGWAIDIHADGHPVLEESFEESKEFAWLTKHAVRYGFRLSYPRSNNLGIIYEPWHWCFTRKAMQS